MKKQYCKGEQICYARILDVTVVHKGDGANFIELLSVNVLTLSTKSGILLFDLWPGGGGRGSVFAVFFSQFSWHFVEWGHKTSIGHH